MWSLFGGSMIVATDVRNMSAWKSSVLLNKEIIAINQDPARHPGYRIFSNTTTNTQLWAKPLANGDIAVVALNTDDNNSRNVAVTWSSLGWPSSASVLVYDLWAHASLGTFTGGHIAAGVSKPNALILLHPMYYVNCRFPHMATLCGGLQSSSCCSADWLCRLGVFYRKFYS